MSAETTLHTVRSGANVDGPGTAANGNRDLTSRWASRQEALVSILPPEADTATEARTPRVYDWSVFGPDHYRERRRGRLPRGARPVIDWERANTSAVARRDGWTCAYCSCPLEDKGGWGDNPAIEAPTIDHVVPTSRGGGDTNYNAVLACGRCNSIKGDRHPAWLMDYLATSAR